MSDLYTMNDVVNGLKTVIDQREARIEQLEAPALPDDVAELIGELEGFGLDGYGSELTQRAADMLERQGRENAQLRDACGNNQQSIVMVRNHCEQRIEQLEAALEALSDDEWWDMETPSTAADFARAALQENE